MKIVNTRDCHILLDYASEKGLQHKLKQRLFSAFFTEQKDVSIRDVLVEQAKAVGLDPKEAQLALEDNLRREKVVKEEMFWQQQGITGVPTVVFNRESLMTGAHPEATYKTVLKELAGL
jgi:predicted DsbA family dithiol-disulfide isomerase